MMATSVIRDGRLIPATRESWGALHQKSDGPNPFAHPVWCITWAQFYAPGRLRLLSDFDDDGNLRAILPLTATGRSGRHWASAGSPFADFGDPLALGELRPGETVAQMLAETREHWSSVALGGLSESVADELATAGHRCGLNVRIIGTEICPCVAVSPSKPWLESLSQTRRRRIAVARRIVQERLVRQPHFPS